VCQIPGVQGGKGSSSPNDFAATPTEGILEPGNAFTVQAFWGLAEVKRQCATIFCFPAYNKYTKAVDRKGRIRSTNIIKNICQ
jgi:hypothetical protein